MKSEKYFYQIIAAFTDPNVKFKGNTAAVVMLNEEWDAAQMQQLAADLHQPATTFLLKGEKDNQFFVRWFAPDAEIGLCGHGSMAALAFVNKIFEIEGPVIFHYPDGEIKGEIVGPESGSLIFQVNSSIKQASAPENLSNALKLPIKAYYKTDNKDIVLVASEKDVKHMQPDFFELKKLKPFGYIVTAEGTEADFVSRTLVPHVQQLEDPATGSSHVLLTSFWAEKLNKKHLVSHQLSKRGGKFICELKNNEVKLSGQFNILAEGNILK